MGPILYVDRGSYNLVIADYSGSPRHRAMTEDQWVAEYRADPSYDSIRTSNPKAIPVVREASVGPWKKDWSGPYVIPYQCLVPTSDKPQGKDGVPECPGDGISFHTITIRKKDNKGADIPGAETVRVLPSQLITVTPSQVVLVDGKATVKVGPTQLVGELFIRVVDVAGVLTEGSIRVRFI